MKIGGSYKCIYYPKYKIVKYTPEFYFDIKKMFHIVSHYEPQNVDFILEYGNSFYLIVGGEIAGSIDLRKYVQGEY